MYILPQFSKKLGKEERGEELGSGHDPANGGRLPAQWVGSAC